jgi:hypothetical protein
MNAMISDRCVICGRRTRREGEPLCTFHDFQALIELGYFRTIERMRHPAGIRRQQAAGIKSKKEYGRS